MATESSTEATIIKKRKAFMVNHKTSKIIKKPTKRIAHFIKPTLKRNALPPKLPKIESFSSSSKPNVVFLCRTNPLKGWKTWVEKFEATNEAAWRKAGIFDAIKCSTYRIGKVNDLIFSLVEKWCPETNTFIFPWGEATVTLEDVYVLGGFSPLGAPVRSNISSILDTNEEQVKDKLLESYRKLAESGDVYQNKWLKHFMGSDNRLEYAGFLTLWLSRHIFPRGNNSSVNKAVFAMAARISCGAKLAFGPAILASIYRELTLLKRRCGGPLRVSSLLHLVQVWAWERFPSLGAVPRMINNGDCRLARWEIKARRFSKGIEFIKTRLDSSRETFRWRPYNIAIENWSLPRFYVDSGMWVVAGSHERWRLFSRCLMAGQLDGLDFVEGYNPHRVALQFGFDQDIPESVGGSEASCTLGGVEHMKRVKRLKMYLPPRLQEGDVTYRYFNWWRTMVNVNDEGRVGCKRTKKTRHRAEKMAKISDRSNFHEEEKVNEINISCSKLGEVEPNRSVDQEDGNIKLSEMLLERKQGCDAINSLCSQEVADHQNFANEVGQVKVMSPSIMPEGGSEECQDNAREQNLIEHNVKMEKSSECLAANIPQTETPTESKGTLIRGPCEDEPARALCQAPDVDTNHGNIVPVNGQLAVSNDENPFVVLCVQYESRISRLEMEISAISFSNLT